MFDQRELKQENASQKYTVFTTNPTSTSNLKPSKALFYNIYYAIITSSSRIFNGVIIESGADWNFFHSSNILTSLRIVTPILIRTTDGVCHLIANQVVDFIVELHNDMGIPQLIIIRNVL